MPTRHGTFEVYSGKGKARSADRYYDTSSIDAIKSLPVAPLAARDCALFLWCTMPNLPAGLAVIEAGGFNFKTTAFTGSNKTGVAKACSRALDTGREPTPNCAF
jgi:N6-adenosine-specific RNA methylase IME4